MAWRTEFTPSAAKALRKLDKQSQRRVRDFLREIETLEDPRSRGKALSANLSGLWRWRVGDLRIIADIVDATLVVLVVDVGHRSRIYHHRG